jgi:hypothetical protein
VVGRSDEVITTVPERHSGRDYLQLRRAVNRSLSRRQAIVIGSLFVLGVVGWIALLYYGRYRG